MTTVAHKNANKKNWKNLHFFLYIKSKSKQSRLWINRIYIHCVCAQKILFIWFSFSFSASFNSIRLLLQYSNIKCELPVVHEGVLRLIYKNGHFFRILLLDICIRLYVGLGSFTYFDNCSTFQYNFGFFFLLSYSNAWTFLTCPAQPIDNLPFNLFVWIGYTCFRNICKFTYVVGWWD